jgi:hypothetical protein
MDSEVKGLSGAVGRTEYTSRVQRARAAPLSPATTGVQVWVKDVSGLAAHGAKALALLLVNLDNNAILDTYTIPFSVLPPWFTSSYKGPAIQIRDVWNHRDRDRATGSAPDIVFSGVLPHDSVFLVLSY